MPATLESITTAFVDTSSLTIRRAQQQLNVSYSSLQRVTHILKLIPYKLSVVHELKPDDPAERVNFCRWFQKCIAKRIDVLDTTFFSDEAWFCLSGYVNTQNTCYWSFTNPNQEIEKLKPITKPKDWSLVCHFQKKNGWSFFFFFF